MSTSSIGVTPGVGEKVSTYEVMEGGEEKHIQRNALNDSQGSALEGQRNRAQSLPTTLSVEDLAALLGADPSGGFIDVPTSAQAQLTTPTRGLVIFVAGNLGVKMADGTENNAKLIPVTPGMQLPFRVVQLTSNNTAGVLGLK